MKWFVYILLCDQKTYYVGLTSNPRSRTNSHIEGYNPATKKFSNIKLVYKEKYLTRKEAEKRERQLKRWTYAKKKALIEGNLEHLKKLSKSLSLANQ